jgi:hypothetical protein
MLGCRERETSIDQRRSKGGTKNIATVQNYTQQFGGPLKEKK